MSGFPHVSSGFPKVTSGFPQGLPGFPLKSSMLNIMHEKTNETLLHVLFWDIWQFGFPGSLSVYEFFLLYRYQEKKEPLTIGFEPFSLSTISLCTQK